jgi:hypothetical protein
MPRLVSIFRFSVAVVLCCYSVPLVSHALRAQGTQNQPLNENTTRTKVVLPGTRTPVPDPDHSGLLPLSWLTMAPILPISDRALCAVPAAVLQRQITALEPANLKVAFVTHLHCDQTAGYSDLILTGWTAGGEHASSVRQQDCDQ